MKFGIALGRVSSRTFVDVTVEADRLGFESVWLPEHLVMPVNMTSSPHPGEDVPPVPPNVHVFDCFAYLSYLAGLTERVRLGTHVYNLALRHPFVAARAVQTLDVVSGGRLELGIGASWLAEEWAAAGLDFHTRGRRMAEQIVTLKRLWTEDSVLVQSDFDNLRYATLNPQPGVPIPLWIGSGNTNAPYPADNLLRRAARIADGFIAMSLLPAERASELVTQLRGYVAEYGRDQSTFGIEGDITLTGKDPGGWQRETTLWRDAGADRLMLRMRDMTTADQLANLRRYVEEIGT